MRIYTLRLKSDIATASGAFKDKFFYKIIEQADE